MLQFINPQAAHIQERAAEKLCVSTECVCGGTMRLRAVQPHLLVDQIVDVYVFDCAGCIDEFRMIRPRDTEFTL